MIFTFRPGGAADPANGVYVTWAGVMAALNAAPPGSKILQWDDSITSPIVIPVGTYAMQDVTWTRAATANAICLLNFGEGRIFTNLRSIDGALRITFSGATPPVSDFVAADTMTLDGGVIIRCSGTGPFFRNAVTAGKPVIFALGSASWLAAGNPVFDSAAIEAFTVIVAGSADTVIDPNMLMGVDGSTIALTLFGIGISALGRGNVSELHPNFNGTLLSVNSPTRWQVRMPAVITGDTALQNANQLVRVDPSAGPVVITLPSARGQRGVPMLIKNVAASNNLITIAPAAGDTVDGDPAGTTIASGRGSQASGLMLISDGVSNWSLF